MPVMVTAGAALESQKEDSMPDPSEFGEDKLRENTSLAVVSVLRRLRLWHTTDPRSGIITIASRDVTNWIHAEELEDESSTVDEERYKSPFSAHLATQQRDIRIMNKQQPSEEP